jgi:DNA polymerase-3 subunit beta
MKFCCEKALILNAINTASRAAAAKSSIPALEGLLIKAEGETLSVCGYNMQTGIRTTVPAAVTDGGEMVLSARLFGDIIRKMPDDVVYFSSDEKLMVNVACGDAAFDILGLSASDFPELPSVEDQYSCDMKQSVLKAMIDGTSFAVSTNESRIVHTGSLFEVTDKDLTMVSVDGFRLALRKEKIEKLEGGAFSFVAPGTALNEVEKICGDTDDAVTIILGSRHVQFMTEDTMLICRRLEGDFLDYRNAIPRKNSIVITAETKALMDSIDRVSVVISDKLKSPVRCVFGDGQVSLSAKTGNGDSKDVCKISGDGKGLEIGFNNRYLMDALRYAPAEKVNIELNSSISPCIIVPTEGEENFLYMVLPVRLRASEG